MSPIRYFASSRKLHAFLAVAFLFVMLVEWGSHSLAFTHAETVEGSMSISAAEPEHDDSCKTFICGESRRHDQRPSNISHDLFPYASILDRVDDVLSAALARDEAAILRKALSRISRPKDPLLHPPEFS